MARRNRNMGGTTQRALLSHTEPFPSGDPWKEARLAEWLPNPVPASAHAGPARGVIRI